MRSKYAAKANVVIFSGRRRLAVIFERNRQRAPTVACMAKRITTYNWSAQVARTTFTIELRMDVASDAVMAAVEAAFCEAARMVFAQSIMLADNKKPQIAVQTENSFIGQKTLNPFGGEV